ADPASLDPLQLAVVEPDRDGDGPAEERFLPLWRTQERTQGSADRGAGLLPAGELAGRQRPVALPRREGRPAGPVAVRLVVAVGADQVGGVALPCLEQAD